MNDGQDAPARWVLKGAGLLLGRGVRDSLDAVAEQVVPDSTFRERLSWFAEVDESDLRRFIFAPINTDRHESTGRLDSSRMVKLAAQVDY